MLHPYLLSGSFAYDTMLPYDGQFQSRILPDSLAKLSVCFDIEDAADEFGGCAGNISYNAGLLKDAPLLIGTLGKDADAFLTHLQCNGQDISTLTLFPTGLSPHAWILTDTANSQITSFTFGVMKHMPRVPDVTPDIWFLSPGNSRTTAALAKRAIAEGKTYFFDPGQALHSFIEGQAEDILPLATILEHATGIFVNNYEAQLLEKATGAPLASLITKPGQFVVHTKGGEGVLVLSQGESLVVPVAKAHPIVDPTGCGDALRGGFMYGFVRYWSLKDCAIMGAVMGARAVESSGGQKHKAAHSELEKAFEEHQAFCSDSQAIAA